jgi:pimeloyl-ACP methyl ester carboxylesterase
MNYSRVSVFALFFLTSYCAADTGRPPTLPLRETCSTLSAFDGRYCIARTEGSQSKDVIFFLHGLNGSEISWGRGKLGRILASWKSKNEDAPTVVTVTFGKMWLLAEKNSRARSGLYEFYMNEFIPQMEKELGGIQGRRILMGESMGGFNASQILMKAPEKFDRAVLLCPAMMTVSPFAPRAEIGQYISRTKANAFMAWGAVGMFQLYYPDDRTWQQVSPVVAGPERLDSRTPPVMVSVGRSDDYGFFEGSEVFSKYLAERTSGSSWVPMDGDHCTWDPEKVSEFLVE